MHIIKALLIAGMLIGGVAHANDRVRVGKSQGSAWTFLLLDVGVEQGLFAKQGIDVEISDLAGDAKLQQAFAAGAIDFGLGSGPGMAFAAKGSPVTAVAAFAGPPRSISAIVLHNSNIQKVADLKGKTIAVSTTGSLSDWLAKQMAIQEGWGQDGIRAAPLGAIPTSIAALKTRQVDAVVLATEAGFLLKRGKKDTSSPRWIATRRISSPMLCSRKNLSFQAILAWWRVSFAAFSTRSRS
jgi:ABC-type nitrate/sulfonate/bicarbonate transport system substrate-binding protein